MRMSFHLFLFFKIPFYSRIKRRRKKLQQNFRLYQSGGDNTLGGEILVPRCTQASPGEVVRMREAET